jgi:hypothetical protein
MSVLDEQDESENPSYFTFTYKDGLFFYGFLTEENPYYLIYKPIIPDIPVVVIPGDNGDDDGDLIFAWRNFGKDKNGAKKFAKDTAIECHCKVSIRKQRGEWIVSWIPRDEGN